MASIYFEKPDFIHPAIELRHLGKGSGKYVCSLSDVSPNIRDRIPHGYVVKVYRDLTNTRYRLGGDFGIAQHISDAKDFLQKELKRTPTSREISDLFTSNKYFFCLDDLELKETESAEAKIEKFLATMDETTNIHAVAKALKERNEFYNRFFEDDLPELVVPSQFIIGSTKQKSQPQIFEFQQRFDDYVDLGNYFFSLTDPKLQYEYIPIHAEKFATEISRRFNRKQISHIQTQLLLFRQKCTLMIENYGKVPDVMSPCDIIITKEGELRILDTDVLPNARVEIRSLEGKQELHDTPVKQAFDNVLLFLDIVFTKLAIEKSL